MTSTSDADWKLVWLVLTGSPGSADPLLEAIIQEKLKGISREVSDRNDKYRKCKQLLMVSQGFYFISINKLKQPLGYKWSPCIPQEEKDRSCMFADELAKMEAKLKEQLKVNDNLKVHLAAEEDRYKVSVAERRHAPAPLPLSPPPPTILDVAALAQGGGSL